MSLNQEIILNPSECPQQKAEAIAGLLTWLDYDCSPEEKENAWAQLDPLVQAALNELWGIMPAPRATDVGRNCQSLALRQAHLNDGQQTIVTASFFY